MTIDVGADQATASPAATPSTSSTRSATATRSSPAATGSTRTSSRSPGPRRRWAGPCSTTTARSTSASSRCTRDRRERRRSAQAFRRTDRTDAPYYLARYTERRGLKQSPPSSSPAGADEDLPLYLRRFRERAPRPVPQRALLEVDGERFTREFVSASGTRRSSRRRSAEAQEDFATEIRIIRHGITRGYSDRLRPDPDGRLAVAPARAQPVQERPARARRSGSSAPTPAGPGRPPIRSTAA